MTSVASVNEAWKPKPAKTKIQKLQEECGFLKKKFPGTRATVSSSIFEHQKELGFVHEDSRDLVLPFGGRQPAEGGLTRSKTMSAAPTQKVDHFAESPTEAAAESQPKLLRHATLSRPRSASKRPPR